MKWGMQAFDTFKVVPPGIGIVHQVNLEYLARGVHKKDGVYYPDTLVGTDSHTTMINGIGVVGWGVGGIEAEAGMLGQPVYFLTPDVVGVDSRARCAKACTATDLVLTVTEMLRKEKVVGKFVEFFGEGTRVAVGARPRDDRQHGARVRRDDGLLPGRRQRPSTTSAAPAARDARDRRASRRTSRRRACSACRAPARSTTRKVVDARPRRRSRRRSPGPKRPQDRIELGKREDAFTELFSKPSPRTASPAADELRRATDVHVADAARSATRTAADGAADCRDGQQPPDARSRRAATPSRRHRQRRRADRRDHVVHQHVEPERAARRRPAREEGGRARASRSSRTSRPRSRRARASSPST